MPQILSPVSFGITEPPPGYLWADAPYLGHGGNGVVFRAYSNTNGASVAVKYTVERTQSIRFQRELHHLSRIDHPHIVRTLGGNDSGSPPYFVMEYLAGGTVAEYARNQPGRRLAPATVMAIALQLADALAYLHGLGLVHRDLKPTNVMFVTPPDNPAPASLPAIKLMDFGLVTDGDQAHRLTMTGADLGTALYMPAEQFLAPHEVDGRADLYALGVLMFELLTGQPPFQGGTRAQLFLAHQAATPPQPGHLAPNIPRALDGLILTLLAKQPDERIASAERLRYDLENLAATLGAGLPGGPATVRHYESNLLRPLLRGRTAEIERLRSAWNAAKSGETHMLIVLGEAGVGKSFLAGAFLESLAQDAALILRSRALRGQTNAFAALVQWIEQGADYLRRSLGRLPAELSPLADILPQITNDLEEHASIQGLTPILARSRLFEAAARLLQLLLQSRPLLLFLDDLQECDPDSAELLIFLLNRLEKGDASVLFLTTMRPSIGEESSPGQTIARHLLIAHHAQQLTLSTLDAKSTSRVVAGMLGHPLPALADAIFAATDGNPLFVVEALRALVDQRSLMRREGLWHWETGNLPLPPSVIALEQQRLQRLSSENRRLLQLAAAIGSTVPFTILQRAAGLDDESVLDLTETWIRLGMVREIDANHLRFQHPLLREVVRQETSARRARLDHRKIAQAMESHFTDLAPHAAGLAYHYTEAAEYAAALPYALQAARFARAQYAFGQAAAILRSAVDTLLPNLHSASTSTKIEVWLALGEAESLRGEHDAARRAYEHAFRLAAEEPDIPQHRRAYLAIQCARETGWRHEHREIALAWLNQARQLVSTPNNAEERAAAAAADIYLAPLLYQQADYTAAEQACRRGLAWLTPDERPAIKAEGLQQLGVALDACGEHVAAQDAYRASLEIWNELGNLYEVHRVENNLAALDLQLGRLTDAQLRLERVVDFFRTAEDRNRTATALTNLGLIYMNRGQVQRAIERQKEALALVDILEIAWLAALVRVNLAWAHGVQGDWDTAAALAQSALEIDPGQSSAEAHRILATVAIESSNLAAAKTHALQAHAIAHAHADHLEEGAALRVLGEIAQQESMMDVAAAHLQESLNLLQRIGNQLEVARTAESLARLYARQGDPKQQLIYSLRAVAGFQSLGALRDLADCTAQKSSSTSAFVTMPDAPNAVAALCVSTMSSLGWSVETASPPMLMFRLQKEPDIDETLMLSLVSTPNNQTSLRIL